MNDFDNMKSEYPDNTNTGGVLSEQQNQAEKTSDNYNYTYEDLGLPPNPDLNAAVYGYTNGLSYFGFSQCGESHIKKGAVCQDRCTIRVVGNFIVAAIADGVGSCALSDYGSYIAVNKSAEYLEKYLTGESRIDRQKAEKLLRNAMQSAYDEVDNFAEEHEQMLFSFQSTLTVAVYDGNTVYFGHAGDDGIVVCTQKGQLEMITKRHKGEEASSVYPLQSVSTWEFGECKNVSSFVMVTDGVLDSFVMSEFENNRIYYSFIQTIAESPINSADEIKELCNSYYELMQSPNYRKRVTDDLTLVAVTNQRIMGETKFPDFDAEEWNRKTQEYYERRKANLYPQSSNARRSEEYPPQQTSYSGTSQTNPNSGYFGQGNLYSNESPQRPTQNFGNNGYSGIRTKYPPMNETGNNISYQPKRTSQNSSITIPPTSSAKQDNDTIINCPYCGFRQVKGRTCTKCNSPLVNRVQISGQNTQKAKGNSTGQKKQGENHGNNISIVSEQKTRPVSQKGKHSKNRNGTNQEKKKPNIFFRILDKIADVFRAEVEDE